MMDGIIFIWEISLNYLNYFSSSDLQFSREL